MMLLKTWIRSNFHTVVALIAAVVACGAAADRTTRCWAADWPQWRFDAGRGAASPEELPPELHLRWSRQLAQPRPAWPASQPALRFDVSYSPVAADGLLFVPSMVSDSVTAYDAETGQERWRFYADGPVRFAPLVAGGKIYFGSDDGFVYCLDAGQGTLRWRFAAGPYERRVLGNERLISTWPVRGGPVLHDGILYFTAGVWPFMGIFVHAVDAATGRAVWTNSGEGANFTDQPHHSPAFGGFAPCGYAAATAHGLIVPGGRTQPACYDLTSGQLRYFDFGIEADRQGKPGSYQLSVCGDWFFQSGEMFALADGKRLLETAGTVHDATALYGIEKGQLTAQAIEPISVSSAPAAESSGPKTGKGKKGQKAVAMVKAGIAKLSGGKGKYALHTLWRAPLADDVPKRLFLKAGSQWIVGDRGVVAAVTAEPGGGPARVTWRGTFAGEPWDMLVADGRLFVVTAAGEILCFAARSGTAMTYAATAPGASAATSEAVPADGLLAQGAGNDGYAVLFGLGTPAVAEQLLRHANFQVIAVDPDAKKVAAVRRRMDEKGWYGARFTAQVGDPLRFALPPYLANLVVVEAPLGQRADRGVALVEAVFHVLRPYGGTALFEGVAADQLRQWVKQADLANAQVKAGKGASSLVRADALPGAADWTHQYADAANSVVSHDQLAKAPLGLLWFGGPSNDEVLPRHGHGPAPQVAGGRLLIEGPDMLRAIDAYTGRLLWQKELPQLGRFYDTTNHQPGAGEIGGNYVTLPDRIYVVRGSAILELDAATGEPKRQFTLPDGASGAAANWGFVAAADDLLLATAAPVTLGAARGGKKTADKDAAAKPADEEPFSPAPYAASSRRLVLFDRHSGELLWQREAKYCFRHNCIALGARQVFCIDGLSSAMQAQGKRRGAEKTADYQPRLLALDAHTGRELWSTSQDVFGTFVSYSSEFDVLLQAGSSARDRADDESKTGMAAYRGADGTVLWKDLLRDCKGPCMLHHDTIITQNTAYALLTGQRKLRQDPLTGQPMPWQFERNYGCNTAIGSEHLLTFRSAAAGFYDLDRDGGTGNFGGFKSGCTSNLVVADGLLNAPEYTRTCTCCYQNQTSLALVYDPEVEMWTFNPFRYNGEAVRRIGINLGAPGDRVADNGTLWLDYPSRGGPSPEIPVEVRPENAAYFCHHSARIKTLPDTSGLAWVAASGVRDVQSVTLTLCPQKAPPPRLYTVRLHFAEVDGLRPGERVFRVQLQDGDLSGAIDIAKEAGPMTALVKEFRGVAVADKLRVSLQPCGPAGSPGPLLGGIEVVAEDHVAQK